MATLDFPVDPIVGQEYEFKSYTYQWDGEKWKTIGTGSNPTNELRKELKPSVLEALRRSYAEAGYNLVQGSFEKGGVLNSTSDVLLYENDGKAYAWSSAYPSGGCVVAPGTDPTTVTGYVPRMDVVLSGQLNENTTVSILGKLVPTSRICVHNFGGNNSPAAWVAAMQYCAANGYVLHVVGAVALTDIAKFIMPDNTRIVIDWSECTGFSVLDSGVS